MALKIGDTLPHFTAKNAYGENFDTQNYIGQKILVIYFYPKDNTPGCTTQACSFRDQYQDFKDLGAEVIGISSDNEASHEKFASQYQLPFILLSDPDKKLRKLFGVTNDYLGLIPGRTTYVVDKKGIIQFVFDSTSAKDHISQALNAIKGANF